MDGISQESMDSADVGQQTERKNLSLATNKTETESGYPIKEGIYLLLASAAGCLTVPILVPAILAFFSFYMIHKRNTFKHMILPSLLGAIIAFVIIILFMKVPMFTPEIMLYLTNIELSSSTSNLQFMLNIFTSLIITVVNLAVFLLILTFLHNKYGLHSSSDKQEDKLIENAKKKEALLSSAAENNLKMTKKDTKESTVLKAFDVDNHNEEKQVEEHTNTIPKKEKNLYVESPTYGEDDHNKFEERFNMYKQNNGDDSSELKTENEDDYKTNNFVENKTDKGPIVKSLDAEFEDPFETEEKEKTEQVKVKPATVNKGKKINKKKVVKKKATNTKKPKSKTGSNTKK